MPARAQSPTARGTCGLIDDYARRSLDAQREWLDAVQEELERPQ